MGWPNRGARNEGEENVAARPVNAHLAEVGVMKKKKKRKEKKKEKKRKRRGRAAWALNAHLVW